MTEVTMHCEYLVPKELYVFVYRLKRDNDSSMNASDILCSVVVRVEVPCRDPTHITGLV